MRKRCFALAAGLAAAMMTGGCSGKAPESAPETGKQQESSAETGGRQESGSASEGEKEGGQAADATGGEEKGDAPLRVSGTILEVGEDGILVDCEPQEGVSGEVMLMIDPEETLVLDGENGYPLELKDVKTGRFEAYLGPAMTMSLPPQTTPRVVIANIPEGAEAPRYVIAGGKVGEADGKKILPGADGTEYPLASDVEVQPWLTKNIVRLEDVESGSRCLLWMNGEGEADRIVLFGEE